MYSTIPPTSVAVPPTSNRLIISGLNSNTKYTVSVCALTMLGCGVAGNGTVLTLRGKQASYLNGFQQGMHSAASSSCTAHGVLFEDVFSH